jgi:hypothetical protein
MQLFILGLIRYSQFWTMPRNFCTALGVRNKAEELREIQDDDKMLMSGF